MPKFVLVSGRLVNLAHVASVSANPRDARRVEIYQPDEGTIEIPVSLDLLIRFLESDAPVLDPENADQLGELDRMDADGGPGAPTRFAGRNYDGNRGRDFLNRLQ